MSDRPDSTSDFDARQLTPERVAILVEFADSVAAGRRLLKLIAWMGAVATGAAALVFYLLAIWNGWHVGAPRNRP